MRTPYKSFSRPSSRTNSVTILAFCAVLLVLGTCGVWYWRHVETQTLLLQERNFRALTVTSHAFADVVANYEKVFKSVIEGKPFCTENLCLENLREAYEKALLELQAFEESQTSKAVPAFKEVKVTKEPYEDERFAVKFIYQDGKCSIQLTYVHQDRVRTKWKVAAVMDIRPVMRQLVTEDIFSDVLLADHRGRVLYHHPSTRDPSGFEFEDVSALLHRLNGSESKENGGVGRNDDLVSQLPLFNEAPIGGIAHAIFAQATDLPADRGTAQTVILVGIVPAGQFHAEARAIAISVLLVMIGLMLAVFFVLPFVKLRTNAPTERLTRTSVAVLVVSSILGIAVLTFGVADIATYHNLEQYLDRQLGEVSEEIRTRLNADVQRGLDQLKKFDESCQNGKCSNRPDGDLAPHCAQRLSIGKMGGTDKEFSFNPIALNNCTGNGVTTRATEVVYRDVISMLWIELDSGEITVFQSRERDPWKHVKLNERQYVRRILEDETLIRKVDEQRFWIEPIFSRTTGYNTAVLSITSQASSVEKGIVAALEVKLPSVTNVGVPPGMGFAVIDQEGEVLFHSDARRNLRENFFKETNRVGRLRHAVFARVTTQFDGGYWGKDRHFHITPLFSPQGVEPGIGQKPEPIIESPDVHWSLVTYWDIDILRGLNLRALYSSGALFLIYGIIALSLAIPGWWISSRANEAAYRWVWPQSEHLHRYQIAISLLVASLIAVGIWYMRPHPVPEMLLWGLLPALASAGLVLSMSYTKADPTDDGRTDTAARPSYRLSYALVVTLILLTFVVIPALAIFRVAVDVEWRLLAKFALYDLEQDRKLQAQKVRRSYPPALFEEAHRNDKVRTEFLSKSSDLNNVYADFPFKSCRQDSVESTNCRGVSTNAVQRGDERLIRWLYRVIDRPRIGQSGAESDIFWEAPEQWLESEGGPLWLKDRSQGTVSPISVDSIPSPIPQWLYSLLVFGGLVPLAVLRIKKIYVFAASVVVLGVFLWFGLIGQALAVLGMTALLYGTYYILPRFVAQRVLLLDFPYPPSDPRPSGNAQGSNDSSHKPSSRSDASWEVFVKEISALPNALCLTDEPTFREKILKQDIKDDFGIWKEQIIREILEKLTEYYMQIWKKCTASQRRSLFNLARDGFLHSRNPDIGSLLKDGLIVADLNLRPVNESFRRFIIRTGLIERLDEDIVHARTSAWFQVWRPIGVGLVIVMVFLVLTQEQYRAITLAFLGVLPGLLGAFSQALTAPKKEKLEVASSV